MTVDLYYLNNGRGAILNASNRVTGKQIVSTLESLYKQHQVIQQHFRIFDLSWCTEYDVTADDIRAISQIDKRFAHINPELMVAVIEPKILEFTLTDVWKAHVEDFLKTIETFDSQAQAIEWIQEKFLTQNNIITE